MSYLGVSQHEMTAVKADFLPLRGAQKQERQRYLRFLRQNSCEIVARAALRAF